MSKVMLIDAAHAEETRVAVVDGTQVEEFDFESRAKKQLRGNIYLAKVTRVEPSLQAAFVEYGGNRHGFLAFNEIHPDYYQIPLADREVLLREEAEDNERHRGGNGGGSRDQAEIGEDGEELHDRDDDDDDDVMDEEIERRRRRLLRRYKIQEVIKRRQIMLVQIVKDERGAKGASLTTYLSLAGRYGVLMPNTARGGGISRKIATASDRKRLKEVVNGLDLPQGMGLIVRTAGAKRTKPEIKRDYEYLMRLWENIRDVTLKSIAPALIYEEEDLVKRAIRDMYDKDVDAIFVEGEAGYKEARDFMRMIVPSQAKKVQHYNEATPLFVKHRIEDGLAQIYSPVVPLRSGGYLVINQTEALVAIDVNSGKSTRERNVESTALKTNLEAAEEAARQLRLRDLAGLIVIDFIDMDESKNNRAVEKKLADALKADRARIQMGKISSFGLMELSRQRRKTGVLEATTHVCSHCQGVGRVRAVESSALSALRAVEIEAGKNGAGEVILKLPRDAALYILNEKRQHLARLQHAHGLMVTVQIDDSIGNAEHEVERTSNTPQPLIGDIFSPPARTEPEVDDFVAEEDEVEDEAYAEGEEAEEPRAAEGGRDREREGDREGGRGRRRRRRGGRGERLEPREGEAAVAGESDAEAAPEGEDRAPRGEDETEGEARRRRGRRGRRGSRRGREGEVAADGYGWTRARTPDGADPYGWYDTAPPVDLNAPAPAPMAANDERPAAPPPGAVAPAAARAAAPAASSDSDIWVELPAEPEKGARGRARRATRGRGKAEAAPVEAPMQEAVTTAQIIPLPVAAEAPRPEAAVEAEAAPAAKPKRAPRRTKAQIAAEAAAAEAAPAAAAPQPEPEPEPELERVTAAAPAPAEPDPAEILAPPAKPKRGWWRR